MATQKLWGGRFTNSTDHLLEKLNSSIHLDKRLYNEDIEGSKAYSRILVSSKLLSQEESDLICVGLDKIKIEWMKNEFVIKDGDEDIHTANERRLKELIGDVAAKLHVGRSRNDQVITDTRLWLRNAFGILEQLLKELIKIIIDRSLDEINIIMPGYTHLQRAQPVRWAHFLLSHAWNFKSDCDKLQHMYKTTNVMPLGSGALAGNPFYIDRIKLAQDLGFETITQNSMQAVGDRDFIESIWADDIGAEAILEMQQETLRIKYPQLALNKIFWFLSYMFNSFFSLPRLLRSGDNAEFLFWGSLTGIHLSRLAEDLIIFSSKEFNFVEISDSFSTGSSLMPQKRNADSLELIRGIAGSLFGHCSTLMMTLKGLPSTYNKDLQNDKDVMFSCFDKLTATLNIASGTVKTLKVNSINCKNALNFDMLATDLAYYLVHKGVPFRLAHHDAGKVVAEAEKRNIPISELPLEVLQSISEHFKEDVTEIWNYENSIEQYQTMGGTSRSNVTTQINLLKKWLFGYNISNKRA